MNHSTCVVNQNMLGFDTRQQQSKVMQNRQNVKWRIQGGTGEGGQEQVKADVCAQREQEVFRKKQVRRRQDPHGRGDGATQMSSRDFPVGHCVCTRERRYQCLKPPPPDPHPCLSCLVRHNLQSPNPEEDFKSGLATLELVLPRLSGRVVP